MIDSTNPRVMADSIRQLAAAGSGGSTVVPNPEGASSANLNKLGIDGTVYGIPLYSPVDYSTDEVDIGVKWIDGSPIYRKTISIGDIASGVDKEVAHGITNIDTVISLSGGAYSTTNSRYIPLPYVDNDDTYQRYLALTATNVVVGKGSNSPKITKAYVTVCYTKTVPVNSTRKIGGNKNVI